MKYLRNFDPEQLPESSVSLVIDKLCKLFNLLGFRFNFDTKYANIRHGFKGTKYYTITANLGFNTYSYSILYMIKKFKSKFHNVYLMDEEPIKTIKWYISFHEYNDLGIKINPKSVDEAYEQILNSLVNILKPCHQIFIDENPPKTENYTELIESIIEYININKYSETKIIPKSLLEETALAISEYDDQLSFIKRLKIKNTFLYNELEKITNGMNTSSGLNSLGF